MKDPPESDKRPMLNPKFQNAPLPVAVDQEAVEALASAIEAESGTNIERNRDLAAFSSWQIGGKADLYLEPPSGEILGLALCQARTLDVPVTVLGAGTNILIADAGIRGLTLRLGKAFDFRQWQGLGEAEAVVWVGSASRFIRLAKETVAEGYGGLEFAAGIPGSTGGAVAMNAGAFGGEISDTLVEVEGVTEDGQLTVWPRDKIKFAYRRLELPTRTVITSSRFRLRRSSKVRLRDAVARVQARRRKGQPQGFANAGSVFKNPPGEFAGRLIERVGLKGRGVGRAEVSREHANFILNLGGATARDVHDLMSLVQDEVWSRCGVWLEPEVRLVGEWV